jgi:hypothetical protein
MLRRINNMIVYVVEKMKLIFDDTYKIQIPHWIEMIRNFDREDALKEFKVYKTRYPNDMVRVIEIIKEE